MDNINLNRRHQELFREFKVLIPSESKEGQRLLSSGTTTGGRGGSLSKKKMSYAKKKKS